MTENRKKDLLIELHYFPCVIYFTLLHEFNSVFLEAEEHFVKQTYRNRAYILTANKVDRLSVPIVHEDKRKPFKLLRIDYKQKWQQTHWRAIRSAYAKAPFFEYYAFMFEKEMFNNYETLWELNKSILTLCLKMLGLNMDLRQTDKFIKAKDVDSSKYYDARNKITPDLNNGTIHAKSYNQLFSSAFIENLSILDLLFNEGPASKKIIESSKIK